MNYHFANHRQVRKNLLNILQTTSEKDLLTIPDGFNNNIYWNIAHCVAQQQLLCYYLSGNQFRIDKYWVETYKKGTDKRWGTKSKVYPGFYVYCEICCSDCNCSSISI